MAWGRWGLPAIRRDPYAARDVSRSFTIAANGDAFEQRWWPQWTAERFPSYETFWIARVAPLTNRVNFPGDISFRTDAELELDGYTPEDVAVAQLHYTVLRHLGRVFELADDAAIRPFGRDEFFESFARLSGASDVADEILARRARPGTYPPWNEARGRDARTAWRNAHVDPLRPIRAYRNRLVHGRVVPETFVTVRDADGNERGALLYYPTLGNVDTYLDWRIALAVAAQPTAPPDFASAATIVRAAWGQVVDYVEQAWQTYLLPGV